MDDTMLKIYEFHAPDFKDGVLITSYKGLKHAQNGADKFCRGDSFVEIHCGNACISKRRYEIRDGEVNYIWENFDYE